MQRKKRGWLSYIKEWLLNLIISWLHRPQPPPHPPALFTLRFQQNDNHKSKSFGSCLWMINNTNVESTDAEGPTMCVLVCELDRCRNNMNIIISSTCYWKPEEFKSAQGVYPFCQRAFLFRVFLFQEPQTFILLPLSSAAQFFPGLRMELLTLLVPYSENCCQVWIKCFIWRFELLLISHKGNFYGIILIGTNRILFILDSLSAS